MRGWIIEGDEAVLYGDPSKVLNHNCDEMGCPSIGHVLKVVDLTTDGGEVMEAALDRVWKRLYPDKSEWVYPAQVSLHVNAILTEYEAKIKELKSLVTQLKTKLTKEST